MVKEIKVPVPDQTTQEVRIVKWIKNEGDPVARGEVILEVETDKSVMEVESVEDGVLLKQMAAVDDMVPVSSVVAYVGQASETAGPWDQPGQAKPPAGQATGVETAAASPESGMSESGAAATPQASESDQQSPLPAEVKELKIPVPDQTTQEVRIVKWIKSEGQPVTTGEVVLEVETDKSVMEVESIADGVLLRQLCREDDMVPVGQVAGWIGPAGTKIGTAPSVKTSSPAPAAKAAPGPVQEAAAAADTSSGRRVKASPMARNLAGRMGLDLGRVSGSGPQGRIVREDVERFALQQKAAGAPAAAVQRSGRIFASPNARRLAKELNVDLGRIAGSGPEGRIVGDDVQSYARDAKTAAAGPIARTADIGPADGQPAPGTSQVVTKMRRAIGMNLQMSFRDTPHFFVTMSVEMTRAMEVREQINAGRTKDERISVNDLVVRAAALALRRYPAVNSRMEANEIHYLPEINVGVATALETGLVVPVLTNADGRNWSDLAAQTKRLAQEARAGKILNAGKGTFTVSNLGMFGVEEFTAIINPPESAILAVGAVKSEVVDIGGGIGVRPLMRMTLCSDHRVIDGTLAARFLLAIKTYLETEIRSDD